MKPLSSEKIEAMVTLSVGTNLADGVQLMAIEIDRLANQLSDCWLLLDELARCGDVQAAAMLRRQQAPGWAIVTQKRKK